MELRCRKAEMIGGYPADTRRIPGGYQDDANEAPSKRGIVTASIGGQAIEIK